VEGRGNSVRGGKRGLEEGEGRDVGRRAKGRGGRGGGEGGSKEKEKRGGEGGECGGKGLGVG